MRISSSVSGSGLTGEYLSSPNSFHDALEGVVQQGFYPLRVYRGGFSADLLKEDLPAEDVDPNHPFIAFVAASPHPEQQTVIYKTCITEAAAPAIRNEILFLNTIAPMIHAGLPEATRPRVVFPRLHEVISDERETIIEEYIEAQAAGVIREINPEVLEVTDLRVIAEVMRACGELSIEALQAQAPELALYGPEANNEHYDILGRYEWGLVHRAPAARPVFVEWIGEDVWPQLQREVQLAASLFTHQPLRLAAADINPSNVLKIADGRLALIDWERVRLTNSPALDYGFMSAVLSYYPHLHEAFLDAAMDLNKDIPDFKEHLRLDFMLNRGLDLLADWARALRDASPATEEECILHIKHWVEQITNALDKKGVWAAPAPEYASKQG